MIIKFRSRIKLKFIASTATLRQASQAEHILLSQLVERSGVKTANTAAASAGRLHCQQQQDCELSWH